mmetsp:Transcript_54400/g.117742  ORF Transcript_54400/g.117742 Transcript_54400/m.117742 type:complete len:224 (+) Transcript_54400:67-738(+)|eukprot:CAMPEP_0170604040 /NCGR_PEP_ID=MMETSP0224-20130122/19218_1 /TAXON_ID=285029 /ORGANISM="Togula jolla, Strain CCCM 725" /LENGTH=223 /DNA_ID=CAMNT_0010928931 /DNA_START=78 /DNA_END=749 /DNA_ORIENTATION=+
MLCCCDASTSGKMEMINPEPVGSLPPRSDEPLSKATVPEPAPVPPAPKPVIEEKAVVEEKPVEQKPVEEPEKKLLLEEKAKEVKETKKTPAPEEERPSASEEKKPEEAAPARAPAAAAAPAPEKAAPPASSTPDFEVVLKKTAALSKIGLDIDKHTGTSIKILKVKDGIVSEYNQKAASSGKPEIKVGYEIYNVNGITGNPVAMADEVVKSQNVRMKVRAPSS